MTISKEERAEWRKRSMNQFCAEDVLRLLDALEAEERVTAGFKVMLESAKARAEAAERERDVMADFLVDVGCPVDYTDYRCRCEDTVKSVCWLEWARQQAGR